VSETAAALGELLDSADEVIDSSTAYLIGQLAAELIASASEADLSRLIVATEDSRQSGSSDREAAPSPRQLLLSMLSGLLQGVLADRQSAGRTHSALTVRERMLNLLAIEPRTRQAFPPRSVAAPPPLRERCAGCARPDSSKT
jgi:hypothetical protein